MSTNTNKLNVPLTINQCYGILSLLDKHRKSSEQIIFGQNDEFICGAYSLDKIFRAVVVTEEDKTRKKGK